VTSEAVERGSPEDYADRKGYDPTFLGARICINLPTKKTRPRDLLTFDDGGRRTSELKYMHFSLALSRKRKLCVWSAVNIDGSSPRSGHRTSWKIDPRIARSDQLVGDEGGDDVYGDLPRFSRGHMTRREDPIWGPLAEAKLGNEDSMHLTNAVPQIQPFNAGIWNGLEDYALEHAREDQMRICVITGPFLSDQDPVKYGVQIPIEFWKVIAFIHDETRTLTATGYTMSQESFVKPEKFVFGEYETRQRPIRLIEDRAGLSFDTLAEHDPLREAPRREAEPPPLSDFDQITFLPRGDA
jgi:endonuclease G, mitochondrial